MRLRAIEALLILGLTGAPAWAQEGESEGRARQIEQALSAAPPSLRPGASVLG